MIALIERDRSLGDSRRALHDLDADILEVIQPHGGRLADEGEPYDFVIPDLNVVIAARSRFPRERHLEYQLLSAMQRIAVTSPETRILVVYPSDLATPEKERFKEFEAAGIEKLQAVGLADLRSAVTLNAEQSRQH